MLDHMILYYVWEYIIPCSRSRLSAAPAAPPLRLRVRDDAQTQWRIRSNRSQWGLGLIQMQTSRGTCTSHSWMMFVASPPFSPFASFSPCLHIKPAPLLTWKSPFWSRGAKLVHSCPWSVVNCFRPPLNPPPFPLLTVPFSSRYMPFKDNITTSDTQSDIVITFQNWNSKWDISTVL